MAEYRWLRKKVVSPPAVCSFKRPFKAIRACTHVHHQTPIRFPCEFTYSMVSFIISSDHKKVVLCSIFICIIYLYYVVYSHIDFLWGARFFSFSISLKLMLSDRERKTRKNDYALTLIHMSKQISRWKRTQLFSLTLNSYFFPAPFYRLVSSAIIIFCALASVAKSMSINFQTAKKTNVDVVSTVQSIYSTVIRVKKAKLSINKHLNQKLSRHLTESIMYTIFLHAW